MCEGGARIVGKSEIKDLSFVDESFNCAVDEFRILTTSLAQFAKTRFSINLMEYDFFH